MHSELLIGIAESGVMDTDADPPIPLETKFRMVKESGVYDYFDKTYPKNPFIKIKKWSEAKEIVDNWSYDKIIHKRKECFDWWNQYLLDHKNFVGKTIHD